MSLQSDHIENILQKMNQAANMKVVFLDIEKYSKRRSQAQIAVINSFTKLLADAIETTAKNYVKYASENDINFQNDLIVLPTGDGAAIAFTYEGLHDVHLYFAKSFLQLIHDEFSNTKCPAFEDQGWCNCHWNFRVRIGISEGRAILYRDINKCYNVAGDVVNKAARVMGLVDGGQICFTESAYRQVVDMVENPDLVKEFREYRDIEIKHRESLNVYLYIGLNEPYINREEPKSLAFRARINKLGSLLKASGLPMVNMSPEAQVENMMNFMESITRNISRDNQLPPASTDSPNKPE